MLTVKDWQRIQDLFHAAVELPEADQDAYLQSACQGDAALYRQVRSLLLSVTTTGIEETVAQVAAGLEEADSPQPGQRIGPWTILRLLGEGGMGRVYLAERADDEYKKQVAIKVVAAGINSPAILARFRRERQILSGLEHPNIARMLEGGATSQGSPYVVMDYVEGLPIDAYFQTNHLSIRARLDLFLQVCSAVQYAHQNFVIHRDIKPGNILVDNTGTPKLLDFGIAKLLEDDLPSNALTRAAERILTPEYASPEQLEGVPVTTASDVYSLGALLFELLSTKPLHTKSRKLNAQDETPKPSATAPRDFQKELSGDLDNIVRKSIAQDPTQRYSTAGQLADDITRYLTGFPVLAQPDRFAYRAKKFLRRHKAGVAVAALFLFSIIGFATAMAYLARQARDEAANATAVSNFLVDIFQTASPEQARGRPATAIEILDRGSQRVRSEMASRPSVQATLLQAMGEVYLKTGEHAKAKPLLEDALKIRERESGPHSLETASALSALASYCDARSQYPEAEKYWKRVLSIREKLLPPNDFKLGETWRDLGMNHYYIGRYPLAADAQRKALAIFRALNRGPEAESARNNLAIADFEMANYQSAAEIHRDNVKRRVARLGETHPLTLTSMNNLTFPLDMLGLLRESNDIAFRVLGIRRKVMGEMHPDTARSWSTYGFGRRALGDQTQSIEALRKAIEIRVARLDPNDVELATARFSLAEALIEEGQNAEAKQLVDQAMASLLSRKIPGRLSVAKRAYGKVYYMLGQREVGEKVLNESIDSWRNLTGRRKLGKAEGLQTRGELFLAEGRTKEAERDFAEALALRSSVYPEQHPTVAFTRACLARAQSRNGQDAQGRELLTKSLQTMEQSLLPTHMDIYIVRAWLSHTPLPAALRSNRRVISLTSAKTQ